MFRRTTMLALAAAALWFGGAERARASLTLFEEFSGADSISTGGCGSTTQACSWTETVPVGATVLGAYLYSSEYDQPAGGAPGGTLNGTAVNYATALGVNATAQNEAYRANVTAIVAPIIASATSGTVSFNVTETNIDQDGEALVIVYTKPGLATQTVGILDGFSASGGDSSSITFASALNPAAPGFVADMRIGDGFSYDGTGCTGNSQVSVITVNSQVVTNVAGCNDDSVDLTPANGNLITIGGDNDPCTPHVAGGETVTASDHERYCLAPYITVGSHTINVSTVNPSGDDNIFLETFDVSGNGVVSTGPAVPEPASMSVLAAALLGFGLLRRKRGGARPVAASAKPRR